MCGNNKDTYQMRTDDVINSINKIKLMWQSGWLDEKMANCHKGYQIGGQEM